MNDNMDYKLTNYKSPAAIVKRTFTSGNKFSRSQIFHPDFYRLYKDNIELEANELPISIKTMTSKMVDAIRFDFIWNSLS